MMYHSNRIMTIVVSASILLLGIYALFNSMFFVGFISLGLGAIFTSWNVSLLLHDIEMRREIEAAQRWLDARLAELDTEDEEEIK